MKKLEPLKTLSPLSEDYIAEHSLELFDLWIIKDTEDSKWGPFETEDLREISARFEDLFQTYKAFNLATEKESPFFKNTKFQRRKPKLVSIQDIEKDHNFLILVSGIKKGPYNLEEIRNQILSSQISLNALASIDKGKSWIKLYEYHEFDRRLFKKKEELPFAPDEQVLGKTNIDIKTLKARQKSKEEEDAIVGLAFIGHGNDKGQKIKPISTKEKEIVSMSTAIEQEDTSIIQKIRFKYIAVSAIATFIIFTGLNTFNSSSHIPLQNKQAIQRVKKPIEINSKKIQARKPARAIKAKKYQPIQQERKTRKKKISSAARKKPAKIYREVHSDDDFEVHTIEEDFDNGRDIASDQLSEDEIDFIERAENGDLTDKEMETYKNFLDAKRDEVQITDFE